MSDCPCDKKNPICPDIQPGESHIKRRRGRAADFKKRMMDRALNDTRLEGLRNGDHQDLAEMVFDWVAIVMASLEFQVEQVANESYLKTAKKPESGAEPGEVGRVQTQSGDRGGGRGCGGGRRGDHAARGDGVSIRGF